MVVEVGIWIVGDFIAYIEGISSVPSVRLCLLGCVLLGSWTYSQWKFSLASKRFEGQRCLHYIKVYDTHNVLSL